MNNAGVNVIMKILPQDSPFNSFGYIYRSGIPGSCGNFIPNFLRNCLAIFHSTCTILHSHWQCISLQISLYAHQHLFSSSVFLDMSVVKEYKKLTGFQVFSNKFRRSPLQNHLKCWSNADSQAQAHGHLYAQMRWCAAVEKAGGVPQRPCWPPKPQHQEDSSHAHRG